MTGRGRVSRAVGGILVVEERGEGEGEEGDVRESEERKKGDFSSSG